jgi:meso-butanediol dehydrogenase/(S,S)-butanediol dehydrogenase/diacetyl reductase
LLSDAGPVIAAAPAKNKREDPMANKTVVITGANGGLGRTLAERFIADGENVVLVGRSFDKIKEIAEGLGEKALAIACDVSSPDSVRAAFAKIAETHPKIDMLVNNAAILQFTTIETATDEQIVGSLMTNLAGPILCSRAAIPMLNRGGHIVNVTSESVAKPFPHLSLYQSSKAGLETFSTQLNTELIAQGIRVTVVRCGQMFGKHGTMAVADPESAMKMVQEAMKRGLDLVGRGTAMYESVTDLFRMLLDLPADVYVAMLQFEGRLAD